MTASQLVYFCHIPKTAGTSLHAYLLQAGGGPRHVPPLLLWDHLIGGEVVLGDNVRIVAGHFGGLFPLWFGRAVRMLTILREPVARALSHINHIQRAPQHPLHHLADGLSVEAYCDHPALRRTVCDLQARYLASLHFSLALLPTAERGAYASHAMEFEDALYALDAADGLQGAATAALAHIEAVGVQEEFARSLHLYARTFGWPLPHEHPRLNRADPGQPTVETLRPAELDAIRRVTAIDQQVYRAACELFRSQCERHGV